MPRQRRRSIDCDLWTGLALSGPNTRMPKRTPWPSRRAELAARVTAVVFVGLIALSLPIVFALVWRSVGLEHPAAIRSKWSPPA